MSKKSDSVQQGASIFASNLINNPSTGKAVDPKLAASRLAERDESIRRENDYEAQRTAYFMKSRL